jgi:hypothetical protein
MEHGLDTEDEFEIIYHIDNSSNSSIWCIWEWKFQIVNIDEPLTGICRTDLGFKIACSIIFLRALIVFISHLYTIMKKIRHYYMHVTQYKSTNIEPIWLGALTMSTTSPSGVTIWKTNLQEKVLGI